MTNLDHFLQFGTFTFPGNYQDYLKNELPDDVKSIGELVRSNFIHRTTLAAGNTGTNSDKKYGDMTKIPWWAQPEDDYLVTAGAMLTELFRKNSRGFTKNKKEKDKLILTCRFVSIMMASILKAKGISCRVRSGFAPYFESHTKDNYSWDHWINQYWDRNEKRWITIDVDGSWHKLEFDPYDMPDGVFDFSAKAWLDSRKDKVDPNHFHNAGGFEGLYPIAWELFYDFHCIMNREIIYLHGSDQASPQAYYAKKPISIKYIKALDNLAELMLDPDKNFNKLKKVWETKKEFRVLKGALL